MTKKITWNSLSDSDKKILSGICPKCQCHMNTYEQLYGWQKCGACGYTRINPLEEENPILMFNLVSK